jgi:hypothetical protein
MLGTRIDESNIHLVMNTTKKAERGIVNFLMHCGSMFCVLKR